MGLFDKLFGNSKRELQKQNLEPSQKEVPNEIKNLKSRDQFKTPEFFYYHINTLKENGLMYQKFRKTYESENNHIALKNISRNLSAFIYIYLTPRYSMGEKVEANWKEYFVEYVQYYILSINKNLINGSYSHSLKILSIGILLEIEQEEFKKISERYVEEGYQDFILDSLVHSQYTQHPITEELQFPNETYIQKLAAIVKAKTKEKAELIVKDALENHFYTKENLQIEYKSHKTEFYSGYWAWEIGALVKILGLDDSSFNDNVYYPYDMVHWNDPKERSSFFVDEKPIKN